MMKNILVCIALVVIICLLLAGLIFGLFAVETDATQNYSFKLYEENKLNPYLRTYLIVDDDTGVNYIAMRFGESMSITPRLNADGSLYVTP